MRHLKIKNWERYQHYKTRNPPWIKLYKSLLSDRDFLKLSVQARWTYIGLLILASETDNNTVNDPSFLCQRLFISPSDLDLTSLFRAGFLLASDASIRREETEKNPLSPLSPVAAKRPKPSKQTDEEWLESLRRNPAYAHIDMTVELGKIDAWLPEHPGRTKTRRFILNWFNRIPRPVTLTAVAQRVAL